MKNINLKNKPVNIKVKRWFDKINGNSYFSYIILLPDNTEIQSKYNLEYGYGDHPFYKAKEHLKELGYINYITNHFDMGEGLQRDVKNFNY